MVRSVVAFLLVCIFQTVVFAQTDSISPGKIDSVLIVELRTNYYPSSPKNYNAARDSMYTWLDVDATDSLTCVYSGLRAEKDGSRTPSNGGLSFNTEHSWPQSFYDEEEPMRGDIHHLYPTWSSPNQSRSNHPFGEISDNLTTSWWYWENGGSISSVPTSKIDQYSEYYNDTFEPREDHKGNVARAMFYFWTMYQTNTHVINDNQDNDAFFEGMKDVLYQWHKQDPVDSDEVTRSLEVESVQGNKNPFIHDTTLVRRAYFESESSSSDTIPDIYISEVYEANGGTVKYVELFNHSNNTIDLSSGSYELLRYSNANSNPASISLTGTVASKSFYVIGDDNESSGVQTVFDHGVVDQNTSSINHNGNDKYVLVRSSTDTLDSFSKDNIENSSSFSTNQVAYRIFSELPNDGSFGQTNISSDGDTVSSGNWRVFDISSSNGNAKLIATPGYNSGIETNLKPQAMITGDAGWRMISIPGNNANLNQISDDTALQGIEDSFDENVFTYDSSGSFRSPENLSSTLTNGEGIILYFYDNQIAGSSELPIILDTDLNEPTGNVTVPLNTKTSTGNSYFTLVGNPFQSNVDLSEVTTDQSLQANIHLLNDGLYEAVAKSGSILKPWQAFWIESPTSNAANEITFPQSSKSSSKSTQSYFSKMKVEDSRIAISLISSETNDQGCEIVFSSDSDIEWDLNDASKLSPNRQNYSILSCLFDNNPQAILSLPIDLDREIVIPLNIQANGVNKEHTIEWTIDQELDGVFNLSLIDKELNTETELYQNGSLEFNLESYSFNYELKQNLSITSGQASISRFELTISRKTTGTESEVPLDFRLYQNYPNPFNPTTTIEYSINESAPISLSIYSISGVKVADLLQTEYQQRGSYSLVWDASGFASGIYYAKLSFKGKDQLIKMVLLK
jgi:endonuclease I